ncbi:hypothetical protein [Mycolicibacter virginiensis]|uniref:hypothetical protein n=1 Tax=Mycolicibacter virginiensis TaxID=1795032 RepID=UPI001F04A597|nr:hypothetical protein [Mycolicibacter virginiensis]ULP45909.1 hypothetical protein MJO54_13620 [Mycolicibacter virginiensis]
MTTTESTEAAELTRAEKAAVIAGAGGIAAGISHFTGNSTVAFIAMACLGVAAVMGFSAGWFVGLTPLRSAPAAPSAGLVGSRIRFGGSVFTVLDDATPSAAAALRGGGRCSVMAVDGGGRTGVLFLELDPHGAVVAAATAELDWAAAGAVSESNSTHF